MVRSPSTGTTRSRRGTTTAKTLALFGVLAVGVVALLFWAPWEPASNAGGGTLRRADAGSEGGDGAPGPGAGVGELERVGGCLGGE